jgi:hypothetical protein
VSDQPRAAERPRVEPAAALARQPASFWLAGLACVVLIVGGVAPWATAFGYASLSGTSMHGWREVGVGGLGLAMLALHAWRGARLPLVVAAVVGVLGAILAIATLAKLGSSGSVAVFGWRYRYLSPAWGLYAALAGAIGLAGCASVLARRGSRPASR